MSGIGSLENISLIKCQCSEKYSNHHLYLKDEKREI